MLYVVAPLAIVAFSVVTFYRDFTAQNWGNASFAAFNAIVAMWAILAYIGIGNTLKDIWVGLTDWMYVDVKPRQTKVVVQTGEPAIDWRAVLYHGHTQESVPLATQAAEQTVTTGKKEGVFV